MSRELFREYGMQFYILFKATYIFIYATWFIAYVYLSWSSASGRMQHNVNFLTESGWFEFRVLFLPTRFHIWAKESSLNAHKDK